MNISKISKAFAAFAMVVTAGQVHAQTVICGELADQVYFAEAKTKDVPSMIALYLYEGASTRVCAVGKNMVLIAKFPSSSKVASKTIAAIIPSQP